MYTERQHTPKEVMFVGFVFSVFMAVPVFFLATSSYLV